MLKMTTTELQQCLDNWAKDEKELTEADKRFIRDLMEDDLL